MKIFYHQKICCDIMVQYWMILFPISLLISLRTSFRLDAISILFGTFSYLSSANLQNKEDGSIERLLSYS